MGHFKICEEGRPHIKYSYHKNKQMTSKGHKETLGGVGYVLYPDYGDGIISVCICPNSSTCTH